MKTDITTPKVAHQAGRKPAKYTTADARKTIASVGKRHARHFIEKITNEKTGDIVVVENIDWIEFLNFVGREVESGKQWPMFMRFLRSDCGLEKEGGN